MSPEHAMSDPANTMMPPEEQKPLVEQVEEDRADEDRETFITESGLVEEVEEEDAKVGEIQYCRFKPYMHICMYSNLLQANQQLCRGASQSDARGACNASTTIQGSMSISVQLSWTRTAAVEPPLGWFQPDPASCCSPQVPSCLVPGPPATMQRYSNHDAAMYALYPGPTYIYIL